MFGYLRLEVARSLRDPRYIVLALAAPVGFYLLFSTLFGGPSAGPNAVTVQVGLMVSMSVYGAMWAVLSATGPRIAQDRSVGWLRQMRLLPVQSSSLLIARLLAALVLVGPTIALVMLTAVVSRGIHLDAGQWIALVAVTWVGIIPIAVLGLAIGYATGAEAAFGGRVRTVYGAVGARWTLDANLDHACRDADVRQAAAILSRGGSGLAYRLREGARLFQRALPARVDGGVRRDRAVLLASRSDGKIVVAVRMWPRSMALAVGRGHFIGENTANERSFG